MVLQVDSCPLKLVCEVQAPHPVPQNVTLFRQMVAADVMRLLFRLEEGGLPSSVAHGQGGTEGEQHRPG